MATIGFIGLGHMGRPMVKNLLAHKHAVKVYDINPKAMANLSDSLAVITSSLSEVVEACDVVITMLQTGEQVKQCCFGEKGIFAHLKKEALYIDSSSIDVETSRELHAVAEKASHLMVDAPVSGGVAAAEAATLTFMVGGTEKACLIAKPILEAMGKAVIHAGKAGSGAAAKICNNMILGISMIAVSEAFALGDKLGLEPKKLFEICSQASGECWSLTKYCPWPDILPNVPSSHEYKAGFMAKMMLKDLKLSQEAADFTKAFTPLGEQATELYQRYVDSSHAEVDFSGIISMFADNK